MTNKRREKRKEKYVTDHVSEAAMNKWKAPPDYFICIYRVIHEELGEICVYVNEEFSSNRKSQELWSISELRQFDTTINTTITTNYLLLLLLIHPFNRLLIYSVMFF